jgi:hypothetical protein
MGVRRSRISHHRGGAKFFLQRDIHLEGSSSYRYIYQFLQYEGHLEENERETNIRSQKDCVAVKAAKQHSKVSLTKTHNKTSTRFAPLYPAPIKQRYYYHDYYNHKQDGREIPSEY